jgi:hypothetical protein
MKLKSKPKQPEWPMINNRPILLPHNETFMGTEALYKGVHYRVDCPVKNGWCLINLTEMWCTVATKEKIRKLAELNEL